MTGTHVAVQGPAASPSTTPRPRRPPRCRPPSPPRRPPRPSPPPPWCRSCRRPTSSRTPKRRCPASPRTCRPTCQRTSRRPARRARARGDHRRPGRGAARRRSGAGEHRPAHAGRDAGLPRRRRGRLAPRAHREARPAAALRRAGAQAALRARPAGGRARTPSPPGQPRRHQPGVLALGLQPGPRDGPEPRLGRAPGGPRHRVLVLGRLVGRPVGHRRRVRRHRRPGAGSHLDPAGDHRRDLPARRRGSGRGLPARPEAADARLQRGADVHHHPERCRARPRSPTSPPTTSTRRERPRGRRTPTRSPTSSTATPRPRGPPRPTSRTSAPAGSRPASVSSSTSARPRPSARWW